MKTTSGNLLGPNRKHTTERVQFLEIMAVGMPRLRCKWYSSTETLLWAQGFPKDLNISHSGD